MGNRVPVTIMLTRKQKKLVAECAHRVDDSVSAFGREAVLRRAVDVVEELTEDSTQEDEETEATA